MKAKNWPTNTSRKVVVSTSRRAVFRELRQSSDNWPKRKVYFVPETSARARAQRNINDLRKRGLISHAVADRGMDLVETLFTPNTVYASVAPDDGGLIFYWKAADMSIEIDVYAFDGFWWSWKNIAAVTKSGDGPDLPIRDLKYILTHFSKEVDAANPDWRGQAS
jgi:hypothetical protein